MARARPAQACTTNCVCAEWAACSAAKRWLLTVPCVAITPTLWVLLCRAAGLSAGSTPMMGRPGLPSRRLSMAAAVAVLQAMTKAFTSCWLRIQSVMRALRACTKASPRSP
ncbi:hypothetical protein D3C72_2172120 [compost metagenome]